MDIDELNKYKCSGCFLFTVQDSLEIVCNAPTNKGGIYIIYAMSNSKTELIYIGSSGQRRKDGTLKIRKGGMKDRIVNGHQFGKIARRKSWPKQMRIENIKTLNIYWWVTYKNDVKDFPTDVERKLIRKYKGIYNCLPKWNNM